MGRWRKTNISFAKKTVSAFSWNVGALKQHMDLKFIMLSKGPRQDPLLQQVFSLTISLKMQYIWDKSSQKFTSLCCLTREKDRYLWQIMLIRWRLSSSWLNICISNFNERILVLLVIFWKLLSSRPWVGFLCLFCCMFAYLFVCFLKRSWVGMLAQAYTCWNGSFP